MRSQITDFASKLQEISVDFGRLGADSQKTIQDLFNLFEAMAAEIHELRAENQKLKDEINRLKGEQGKPAIRPQTMNKDISSEEERRKLRNKKKKVRKSKAKLNKIRVDRTVVLQVDKANLPADVVFKGYETVVVQDILIKTDNVEFRKEVYYSQLERKTYRASMPAGYDGEFGPGIRSLILALSADSSMTQPAILSFLNAQGISISAATISRILSEKFPAVFLEEKENILRAGIASSDYIQIDDTSARVNGQNHFTHVLCNFFFTAYVTLPRKDRISILEILSQKQAPIYKLNERAFELMEILGLPKKHITALRSYSGETFTQAEMDRFLAGMFPNQHEGKKSQKTILEACAISAYQDSKEAIPILICDDAPQFKLVTQLLGLCWIHEARHYKKLSPFLAKHQEILQDFIEEIWAYYERLLDFKEAPSHALTERLSKEFDRLFEKETGYEELDKRIAITLSKKAELLLVLKHPHIPLHNNAAELGARAKARSRDINLHTKSTEGTKAKDALMTLAQTCRKLQVNVFDYIYDRVSELFQMPSLASIIKSTACHDGS
jgi:Transposase IS66 family